MTDEERERARLIKMYLDDLQDLQKTKEGGPLIAEELER